MIVQEVKKWVGYLEHQSPDLLGIYTANYGKGGYTIFSEIIAKHYRWRNYQTLPWCVTFVHAVFIETLGKENAARLLGKPHPGTKVLYRRMKRKGLLRDKLYIPQPGDLVFLTNDGKTIGHVGIVADLVEDTVISIEGNTTDPSGHFDKKVGGAVAIRERPHDDSAILCYAAINSKWKGGGSNRHLQ